MSSTLWVAVLSGLSSILVVLLTQAYSKNASLRADLKGKKQKLYADYVGFLYTAYSESVVPDTDKMVATFKSYFPKLFTFASNEVITNAGDFMQHIYKYDSSAAERGDQTWNIESMEYFGDLILAIRKDLGHKRFNQIMKWHDIARLWITDIDTYVPEQERTPRAVHNGPRPKKQ